MKSMTKYYCMPLKGFKFTLSPLAGNSYVFKILTVCNSQFATPFKDIRYHDATPFAILECTNENFQSFKINSLNVRNSKQHFKV